MRCSVVRLWPCAGPRVATVSDLHLDATMGAAGDMILAALVDAGADEEFVRACVSAVAPEVSLAFAEVRRCGLRARSLSVVVPEVPRERTWASIREELAHAELPAAVKERATTAFAALARAEAEAHGVPVGDIHFHEVGAWDALADIVGGCAALVSLNVQRITCGPVATGSGYAATHHGRIPVPGPAVTALLAGTGAQLFPGPASFEACTPTAAALLATWTDEWTAGPRLAVAAIGIGAGTADPPGHPNITRVLLGESARATSPSPDQQPPDAIVLETNIDDMDPRLWPAVLEALLEAGAADAWLSPIIMKKGRPAHTLHVLCRVEAADRLAEAVLLHTTAIGMRSVGFHKVAAERRIDFVTVFDQPVRVKTASFAGRPVNVQPEWEDVRSAARATGLPAKRILAAAVAAASGMWP